MESVNGRLTMIAIIGMFFQDGSTGSTWVGGWTLYAASPLRALEMFANVPDGLVAITKVLAAGWGPDLHVHGLLRGLPGPVRGHSGLEGRLWLQGLGLFGSGPEAEKLATESANGRLAMMSIIGMFFQNGLTCSAWLLVAVGGLEVRGCAEWHCGHLQGAGCRLGILAYMTFCEVSLHQSAGIEVSRATTV